MKDLSRNTERAIKQANNCQARGMTHWTAIYLRRANEYKHVERKLAEKRLSRN